jgi:plasmid stabilization system protein ParE
MLNWLARRIKLGVEGDRFRLGHFEVRAGDWLLMRNPSPYNTFTDLSPGLFTHVGVVAVEDGSDGIRRFVIADLPERGEHVPATNVEAYLVRTLHYFFLRHESPEVGKKMGQVAAILIGNETQFDLTFRTDRVLKLKGKPLENQRLNTYCAGFLLLCAQETTAPRSEFFPIPENPPGHKFLANLAKLDISIGDHFVSPTGAVFSPHLKLVGRRRPMYSPDREIKEAIYDHFGYLMIHQDLTPTQNTFQSLRTKVASLSQSNPWLARALAKAGNVSEHMDLQAAAKTAAVIETLDEIADDNMNGFLAARTALLAPPLERLSEHGFDDEGIRRTKAFRKRHADLFERLVQRKVTLREMRIELVDYYILQGKRQLRERFFQGGDGP